MSMHTQLPQATAEQLLIEICRLPPDFVVAGTITASEVSYTLQWLIGESARTRKCEKFAVGLMALLEEVLDDGLKTNMAEWRRQAEYLVTEGKK